MNTNKTLLFILMFSLALSFIVSCSGGEGSGFPEDIIQEQTPSSHNFYAIDDSGVIIESGNGTDWTTLSNSGITSANISVVLPEENQTSKSTGAAGTICPTIVLTTLNDIYNSSDCGKSWNHAKSPGQINNMINVGGTFILVGGGSGFIERSTDGINWDTVLSEGSSFLSVAYGPDRIIATGMGDRVIISLDDGQTWINDNGGNGYQTRFNGIIYGNGKFVAVGTAANGLSSRWATSTDGLTWENETVDSNYISMWDVAFGGGVFITGGYKYLLSSRDGITWSNHFTHEAVIRKITYYNGLFIAAGQKISTGKPMAFISSDSGISWSELSWGQIVSGTIVVDVTTDVKPAKVKIKSRIKGKLLDANSKQPLKNVIVDGIDIDSGTIVTTQTNALGEYIIDIDHNGDFELSASLNAYHPHSRLISPVVSTLTNNIELFSDQ